MMHIMATANLKPSLFAPTALLLSATAVAIEPDLPPIAALFETRIHQKTRDARPVTTRWYFFRDGDSAEVRDYRGHTGEHWQRDPSGKVFYSRLYHEDRTLIEFAPTEFQAATNWGKAAALVDPAWLGTTLKLVGKPGKAGVQRYRGMVQEGALDVSWRPDLGLPVEIRGDHPDRSVRVRLQRQWPLAQAPVAMSSKVRLAAYRQIDGADLGDMETDPFITRVLGEAGHDHHP